MSKIKTDKKRRPPDKNRSYYSLSYKMVIQNRISFRLGVTRVLFLMALIIISQHVASLSMIISYCQRSLAHKLLG
jgi:hypothetical protein